MCNKPECKFSPALVWPDLSVKLKSLLLLILPPCSDLSRAVGQSNVSGGSAFYLTVAAGQPSESHSPPSLWSHLSLAHSQILDNIFLDYHRSEQAQSLQRKYNNEYNTN